MAEAIGQTLPMAIGIALSPLAIVAVVLMLVTERARVNGPTFVLGWFVGLCLVGLIVLELSSGSAEDEGEPATWVSLLELAIGLLLLLIAARQWRARPGGDEEPAAPKWMGAIDSFGPGKSFAAGVVLTSVNPKNLLLAIAAATTIAQTGIDSVEQAISYLVFAVIATLGVGVPVLLYFALGEKSQRLLADLKDWMGRNNSVIMAVLCLVIGFKLIGDAITGLG